MRKSMIMILSAVIMGVLTGTALAQWTIDLETGVAVSGYNDVRIPGEFVGIPEETPTKFSLSQELKADPTAFWRIRFGYSFGHKHHLSLLFAPLRIHSSGTVDRYVGFGVRFAGTDFAPNALLKSRYRFDSYRLTYRYDFHRRENLTLGVGLTIKVRDASISLTDGEVEAEKSNTGLVPLINFMARWRFHERLGALLEGDALAAPQGRAEDVLAAITGQINERLRLKAGYRILEGGADNAEVYTFALVNYFLVGAEWEF